MALVAVVVLSPSIGWAQSKEAWGEVALLGFTHFLAMTSAGVEVCGKRFPESKAANLAAYQRARGDNIEVFVKVESNKDFPEYVNVERARMLKETDRALAEYCAELPQFIAGLADQAPKLLRILGSP